MSSVASRNILSTLKKEVVFPCEELVTRLDEVATQMPQFNSRVARSLQRDTIIESSAAWKRAVIPLRRGVDLKLLAFHDGLRDTVNLSEGWGKTGGEDSLCVTLFFLPRTNARTLDCN